MPDDSTKNSGSGKSVNVNYVSGGVEDKDLKSFGSHDGHDGTGGDSSSDHANSGTSGGTSSDSSNDNTDAGGHEDNSGSSDSSLPLYAESDGDGGDSNSGNGSGNGSGGGSGGSGDEIVPCFTPGSMIATMRGERRVQDLKVGDRIITRDNGAQEIRWIGHRSLSVADLKANPRFQPILLLQGALGNGLPERDLLLSPNHRILINNPDVGLLFNETEVLVAAKHMIDSKTGIQSVQAMGIDYIHFMFDNHEVVLSDGAWTESFQPGDLALNGVEAEQRSEIFDLFPDLEFNAGREAYTAARPSLKRHEAKMLMK